MLTNLRLKSRLNIFVFALAFFLLSSYAFTSAYAFSFAVMGDSAKGDEIFSDILTSISNDKSILFAIHAGDFAYNGKASEYDKYLSKTKNLRFKIYHTMGNHDAAFGGYRLFNKYFGNPYYSFDYGNCHFIILDNAFKGDFNAKQYAWLKNELEQNKKKLLFVVFHKPAFDPSEIFPDYVMDERQIAEELQSLFERYQVKSVFSGHLHCYAKAIRGGVTYIIAGGAGSPLHLPNYLGGFHHYMKITVNGEKVRDSTVRLSPE